MRLVHFSKEPVTEVYSRVPVDSPRPSPVHKPRGLWVSDEDDYGWAEWCKDNDFGIGKLAHEVTLAPGADILRIESAAQLLAFTQEFSDALGLLPDIPKIDNYIRWDKVADAFDGILITPYQWPLRLDDRVFWYYGWDCASGCIWNAAAVERIEPLWETAE